MKKENFDEMLKDALREYVKDTESEPTEKIKFSKRHERNMESIFKSIENGTLGNFEVVSKDDCENSNVKANAHGISFSYNRFAKVAIFVISAIVVSLAVAPGIEAWRTDELSLYGENQDEYAWILPNDISGMLEVDNNSGEQYLEIFGYLPEGTELEKVVANTSSLYIKVISVNGTFNFKVNKSLYNISTDSENVDKKEILIDNMKVNYYIMDNNRAFLWNNKESLCHLYGNLEYSEMISIIENIDYDKIEKYF